MRRIVFIVHTEYHLIEAVSIINQYYRDDRVIVYQISPYNSSRLTQDLNTDYSSFEYKKIYYNNAFFKDKIFKFKLLNIVNKKPDECVIFQEHELWMPFLLNKLNKNKTVIYLAPDGAKVYNDNKYKFRHRFIYNLKSILYRYSNNMFSLDFILMGKYYGASKYVDYISVENESAFNNRYNKKIKRIKVLSNKFVLEEINKIFKFKGLPNYISPQKKLLFIDNPITNEAYRDKNVLVIREFLKYLPEYKLIIKLHPLCSKEKEVFYKKQFKDVLFLPQNYPIEIYMLSFKDSVFISSHSTSFLFKNSLCRYFWFYPLLKDVMPISFTMKNPTDYIKVINSFYEIKNILGTIQK